MSRLGIYASQISGHLTPATSYDSIATTVVGGTSSTTITFSSIPSTYKHLQIRCLVRSDAAAGNYPQMIFNSDTGSNYTSHDIYGNGSSAGAEGYASVTSMGIGGGFPNGSDAANTFGVAVIDILNYSNTTTYKTMREICGGNLGSSGQVRLQSGLWMNTGAITNIQIKAYGAGAFTQYSSFALYGIRG